MDFTYEIVVLFSTVPAFIYCEFFKCSRDSLSRWYMVGDFPVKIERQKIALHGFVRAHTAVLPCFHIYVAFLRELLNFDKYSKKFTRLFLIWKMHKKVFQYLISICIGQQDKKKFTRSLFSFEKKIELGDFFERIKQY